MSDQASADNKGIAIGGNVSNSAIFTGDMIFQRLSQAYDLEDCLRVEQFKTLVQERTRNFVGREYILNAIRQHLNDPAFSSGYLIISGEPGVGKTTLMAKLVVDGGYAHHFNIATQNLRSARDFLSNLCAQLIVRYGLEQDRFPKQTFNDSGVLSQLLEKAAEKVRQDHPQDPRVIVLVDALDEADGTLPGTNCLYLPSSLPERVYFIVTSREKTTNHLVVDHRRDIRLGDDDPQNLVDVQHYIRNFLTRYSDTMNDRLREWGVNEPEFIESLTERSQGNFMYLVYVLQDIRDRWLTKANIDSIHSLPRGLKEYYQRHWQVMEESGRKQFNAIYRKVVCAIAAVERPISIRKLAEYVHLDIADVQIAIKVWREFLNMYPGENEQEQYYIYHNTFQRFLRDDIGLVETHRSIADLLKRKKKI